MNISGFLTEKHAKKICSKLLYIDYFPAVITLNHVSAEIRKALLKLGYKDDTVVPSGGVQIRIYTKCMHVSNTYSQGDIDAGDDEELFLELAKQNYNNKLCALFDY